MVDRNRGRGDGREAEGRFGTAMNISLAHLFMQYFALAGLRLLPLSAGSAAASSLPPLVVTRSDKYAAAPYTSDNILRLSVFELFS